MSSLDNDATSALYSSSFSSFSSLIALQLFSRLFTFILNQALVRLASPRAFGAAAIQFELVLSTILFLSREGIRNALLRVDAQKLKEQGSGTRNLAFVPMVFGVPVALGTAWGFGKWAGEEVKAQPGFGWAVWVYGLAALVELGCEPMHNMAMAELKTGVRVRAEGLGITSKSIVTFLVLWYDDYYARRGKWALGAFAAGQLVYAIVVLCTYAVYFGLGPLLPRVSTKDGGAMDPEILGLSLTMTSQSLVKHFLTEGDKVILSWFSPLQDQGGYALAVNYGSLIARIIFQPIEETLRVFFAKILPSASSTPPSHQSLKHAADFLISLLSIQISLSVILVTFGSAYLGILLPSILPRQYLVTSAPKVLEAWVWYIPVLALNGGLEAFMSSVATTQDLNRQSRWMVAFSAIYIGTVVFLYSLQIGDASLVYANIINLAARIAYCLRFARLYFVRNKAGEYFLWRHALPGLWLLFVAAVSRSLIWFNERRMGLSATSPIEDGRKVLPLLLHVGFGGVLGVVCLAVWWLSSGRYLSIPGRSKQE